MTLSTQNSNNLLKFWDWMETTGRAVVVKFNATSTTLRHLLNNDPKSSNSLLIDVFSDRIKAYQKVSPETKTYFIKESIQEEWQTYNEDLYSCYQMYKTMWLMDDIGLNGQQAPVQLIQSGRRYMMHPGSDKKFSTIFLKDYQLDCFYVWYPELDNTPWHWTYPHEIVKTPEEFIQMFAMHNHPTFQIMYDEVKITEQGATCEHNHVQPLADGLWMSYKKNGKLNTKLNVSLPILTYTDAVHRIKMQEQKHRLKSAVFVGDYRFYLGHQPERAFTKINDIWYPDVYLNFPKSLHDSSHQFNPLKAIYYSETRANLSMLRDFK